LKIFKQFVSQLHAYMKACHIQKNCRVCRSQFYLQGKALDFYLTCVQIDEKEWHLEESLDMLFKYCFPPCFPPGFCADQHKKLAECKQDGHSTDGWFAELNDLAHIVGNIPDEQMVFHLWEGANGYLKVQWAEHGFNPETSTSAELRDTAPCFEHA
ncbi:hypothetical protein SCHPADRAFT_803677, partial [Schizopora paradoxa]